MRNALDYLTLAYSGSCPGRFEVGCQIPMPFNFAIPVAGATVSIRPKQPNVPIALVADRSGAGLVLARIDGPSGKDIRMEGLGLSAVPYDLGEFTNAALRGGNINPWVQNVGLITTTDGIDFVFTAGLAADFRGYLYGFVEGWEGIKYAQKCGLISDGEMPMWQHLAEWQKTGTISAKLMSRLERLAKLKPLAQSSSL